MRRPLVALLAAPLLFSMAGLPAHAAEQSGEVSGVWFFDRNQDGQQQPHEPGAGPFRVELLSADRADVVSVATEEDGRYRFADLAPGEYKVRFTPDGYAPTTPEDVPVTVEVGGTATANFGMRGGQISGLAWLDVDTDGRREESALAMPRRPIRLEADGEPVAYTDDQGRYTIQDLPLTGGSTEYSVYFGLLGGYEFTLPLVGDPPTDSDVVDPRTGEARVTLRLDPSGVTDATHIDAGYVMNA